MTLADKKTLSGTSPHTGPSVSCDARPKADIPSHVYWKPETANFYDFKGNGMGDSFYQEWRKRAVEFPTWVDGEEAAFVRYADAGATRPSVPEEATPSLSAEFKPPRKRAVQAYHDSSGGLHTRMVEAVRADIRELLEPLADHGLLNTMSLSVKLTQQPLKSKLIKLLEELS